MNELQNTPEWQAQRLGRVTASRMGDMLATTKSGWGASRRNYMAELITERLTGVPYPHFVSPEMQHGINTQDAALAAYEKEAKMLVGPIGFVPHPRIPNFGCSPDGLVGEFGLVEVKAPNTSTHIETLRGATIDRKYILQTSAQMACTGRRFVDFVSYDDRLSPAKRLIIIRLERVEKTIATIEEETIKFLGELEAVMAEIEAKRPEPK